MTTFLDALVIDLSSDGFNPPSIKTSHKEKVRRIEKEIFDYVKEKYQNNLKKGIKSDDAFISARISIISSIADKYFPILSDNNYSQQISDYFIKGRITEEKQRKQDAFDNHVSVGDKTNNAYKSQLNLMRG